MDEEMLELLGLSERLEYQESKLTVKDTKELNQGKGEKQWKHETI